MAKLFQFFILCILQMYSLSFNIPILHAYHLCPHDQSRDLLNFKDSLHITSQKYHCVDFNASLNTLFLDRLMLSSYCDLNSNKPFVESKIGSWNGSTDCCSWKGVTCDEFTGNVIELDLSASRLGGVIDSNNSIFQLSHLERFNLADNFFEGSISPEFRRFTRLTHLNLRRCLFQGEIPYEISHLNKLISLDLSSYMELILKPDVFNTLLQNMTRLRKLSLDSVHIISSVPNNLSSSLTIIDISAANLKGTFPYHIFHLPKLEQLSLRDNSFDGYVSLASVKWNTSSPLQKLDLHAINLSGKLPNTIGNLKCLTYLDLSYGELTGTLPQSLGNLTQLGHLDLAYNQFNALIPPEILGLEHLTWLNIAANDLDSRIAHSASNKLKSLKVLSLGSNNFSAISISSFFNNLTQLQTIDLSNNPLYEIPLELFELLSLQSIDLASTQLHGPIPQTFSKLVNLRYLKLASNNFSGSLGIDALSNLVNLKYLNLASNNFTGPIEIDGFSNLFNLTSLDLSSNNFCGTLDVRFLSNFKWIGLLDLSFSGLTLINDNKTSIPTISIDYLRLGSCNISDLDVLKSFDVLMMVYLPNNNIRGELPEWVWSRWSSVWLLDLSNNFITHIGNKIPLQNLVVLNLGSNLLQDHLPYVPHFLELLYLSNNKFYGEFKSSICKLKYLILLDLSINSFGGALPDCIWLMNNKLVALDLHMNNLQGGIPDTFPINSLRSMNLGGNHFEGVLPRSLINCSVLEVLDLSENHLNDTFPLWLGALPYLQILSLRSNKIYGHIPSSHASDHAFSHIQILDLSCNQLNGSLPVPLLKGLKRMMSVNDISKNYSGLLFSSVVNQKYYNSMRVVINGNTMKLERILDVMTIIDLSSNKFEGEIPNSIGGLIGIQQLNLSHNKFRGQIPSQVGYLSRLHSFDLSSNQLEGNIPDNLADLGFLSVMNLSYNNLTGRIPNGPQLQTISNDSYIGNDGLCGFPLSRKCGNDKPSIHVGVEDEGDHQELFDGFTWQSVVMGYGVGMLVGLVIGSLMLFTEKPKWLIRLVREEANKIIYKYKSRNGISFTWNRRS